MEHPNQSQPNLAHEQMGHPVGIHNSPVEYLDSLVVVSLGRVQHGVGVDLGAGRPRVGLALVRELLGLLAVG